MKKLHKSGKVLAIGLVVLFMGAMTASCTHKPQQYTKCGSKKAKKNMKHFYSIQFQ